jgi:hypothetical protein
MASGRVGGTYGLNFLLSVILLHFFSDFRLGVDHTCVKMVNKVLLSD